MEVPGDGPLGEGGVVVEGVGERVPLEGRRGGVVVRELGVAVVAAAEEAEFFFVVPDEAGEDVDGGAESGALGPVQ